MISILAEVVNNYFQWLRGLVDTSRDSSSEHDALFSIAWSMAYEYFIPNDINRAADGINLRNRFISDYSVSIPDLGECRVLEFLIALAIRMDEACYIPLENNSDQYFWVLVENLGLLDLNESWDPDFRIAFITSKLETMMNRTYEPNGHGGCFPLSNPKEDQRNVEVWYQMQAYIQENL